MQTVIGKMRMYHPAQKPATGNPTKRRIRNQMILQRIDAEAILNVYLLKIKMIKVTLHELTIGFFIVGALLFIN